MDLRALELGRRAVAPELPATGECRPCLTQFSSSDGWRTRRYGEIVTGRPSRGWRRTVARRSILKRFAMNRLILCAALLAVGAAGTAIAQSTAAFNACPERPAPR